MKALVTGGAGFIGSHLVEALLESGREVAVLDSLATGRIENVPRDASFYQVDVTDRSGVADVFAKEQPEIVCHYAAQASVPKSMEDPAFDANCNITGSLNVLLEAMYHGARRFVFASSAAVYGVPESVPTGEDHPTRPTCPYGVAKLAVEQYVAMYGRIEGLSYACLRYANVFGPRQDPFGEAGVVAIFVGRLLRKGPPVIFGDGEQTRDYVYVGDAAQAALKAIESPEHGIYNIGTGIETSVLRLAAHLDAVTGSGLDPVFGEARTGDVRRSALAATSARAALGWSPSVDIREGLYHTWRWHKEHSPA